MSAVKKQRLGLVYKSISRSNRVESYVSTSLFSEAFVFRDIEKEMSHFWNDDEMSGFFDFWHQFSSYVVHFHEKGDSKYNLSAEETYNEIILPMLQVLGHGELDNPGLDHFINLEPFNIPTQNGEEVEISVPVLVTESASDKKFLMEAKENPDLLVEMRKRVKVPIVYDYFDSFADDKIQKYDSQKSYDHTELDKYSHMSEEGRCVEYLNLLNLEFGIVTDGSKWRLVNRKRTKEDEKLVYEFDLIKFMYLFEGISQEDIEKNEQFYNFSKWFFWFFSAKGLYKDGLPFVSELESRSKKYVDQIEEDMRTRFVHAMTIGVNGYVDTVKTKDLDLDLIVKTSESLIFNLFFLRSCESRGAIPFHQGYKKISLANVLNKVEYYSPEFSWGENLSAIQGLEHVFGKQISDSGTEVYDHVFKLFKMIKNGDHGFEIVGFVESVFDKDEFSFFKAHKLSNEIMMNLLHELMFYRDGNKVRQIPYNTFSPRQLGSIYESFLEFKLFEAKSNLYYLKKVTTKKGVKTTVWQWLKKSEVPSNVPLSSLYCVKKGNYIFSANNEDRKSSGSYYTPQYIVDVIVEDTLRPLTSTMEAPEEIFNLNVCDPAMGSAHFLLGALNFLADEHKRLSGRESKDIYVKREILDACIFGVDLNPRAIKLAKMSLWLATAFPGKKLEKLSDQLLEGNSLIEEEFHWEKEFKEIFKSSGGFDAMVGNPPWISLSGKHGQDCYDDETIEKLISFFGGNTYMPNTYEYFIKQFMRKTRDGGRFGFIVPDRFGFNQQFVDMRKEMLDGFTLDRLVYKADFPGVIVDTLILISEKKPASDDHAFYVSEGVNAGMEILQRSYDVDDYAFSYSTSGISKGLVEKIVSESKSLRVENLCKTTSGFGGKSSQITQSQKTKKQIKVIKGASITNYKIIQNLWFDFCRANITGRTTDPKKLGAKPKVLLRKTGIDIIAAYDNTGIYPEQSLYFLYEFDESVDPLMVLGFFNSKVLNFYYQEVAVTNKNSVPQLKKTDLDMFPIPIGLSCEDHERIVELVKEQRRKGFKENLQAEIDEIFFSYYGLTQEEIEFLSSYLEREED
jgi:type I restriction-modification system DNA methylase subunit